MTSYREIICPRYIDIFQPSSFKFLKDELFLINRKEQNNLVLAWCLKIRQLLSKLD